MKWYKVTFFYKGKQQDTIIKSLNKAEAIINAKKLNKGLLIKVEEIPMPFEERLKLLKDIFFYEDFEEKTKISFLYFGVKTIIGAFKSRYFIKRCFGGYR